MMVNCEVIVFFQFIANFQPSGSQIPDTWSIKLIFSLTKTFCITKTENRTKKYQLSYYCSHTIALSKDIIFAKKC